MQKSFQVLAAPADFLYEEKKSRFIAYLSPIESREDAMAFLETLREKYPDARHHCWAYILGDAEQPKNAAFSDDGEPSGTAGKPMLNVLTHRLAGDTMAVVVRYFGGIKLGAGGLVRAYGAAVSQAIDKAEWTLVVPTTPVVINVDFALEERVRNHLGKLGIDKIGANYLQSVELSCDVPFDQVDQLKLEIVELTSGKGSLSVIE